MLLYLPPVRASGRRLQTENNGILKMLRRKADLLFLFVFHVFHGLGHEPVHLFDCMCVRVVFSSMCMRVCVCINARMHAPRCRCLHARAPFHYFYFLMQQMLFNPSQIDDPAPRADAMHSE